MDAEGGARKKRSSSKSRKTKRSSSRGKSAHSKSRGSSSKALVGGKPRRHRSSSKGRSARKPVSAHKGGADTLIGGKRRTKKRSTSKSRSASKTSKPKRSSSVKKRSTSKTRKPKRRPSTKNMAGGASHLEADGGAKKKKRSGSKSRKPKRSSSRKRSSTRTESRRSIDDLLQYPLGMFGPMIPGLPAPGLPFTDPLMPGLMPLPSPFDSGRVKIKFGDSSKKGLFDSLRDTSSASPSAAATVAPTTRAADDFLGGAGTSADYY